MSQHHDSFNSTFDDETQEQGRRITVPRVCLALGAAAVFVAAPLGHSTGMLKQYPAADSFGEGIMTAYSLVGYAGTSTKDYVSSVCDALFRHAVDTPTSVPTVTVTKTATSHVNDPPSIFDSAK